jgi:hypothetical protein
MRYEAMRATLEGRIEEVNIKSLHFSAETKRDEQILKNLLEYYKTLSAEADPDERWIKLDEFIQPDCYQIMMVIDGHLTEAEISRASGCLGYALKEVLAGEDLSEPEVRESINCMRFIFYYDSTKSRRDDPDLMQAFEKAERYIEEGTPVRKTNRAGYGTRGTRLVEGIGPRKVEFYLM